MEARPYSTKVSGDPPCQPGGLVSWRPTCGPTDQLDGHIRGFLFTLHEDAEPCQVSLPSRQLCRPVAEHAGSCLSGWRKQLTYLLQTEISVTGTKVWSTWLLEQRGEQHPSPHTHVRPHVTVASNVDDIVLQPYLWYEQSPRSRLLDLGRRLAVMSSRVQPCSAY
ncbi:uncharacterized protein [Dermacentor albipictus]|uniref:uncharacterized protein isoform X3 n=1 Tax=Dermacentor albipictus TaxID=60249 RepID=UPI0031FD48D8